MKAVCLLSGGLDSATAAAIAKHEGYKLYCLSFNYGQIATNEIESAKKIAKALGAKEHRVVDISFLKQLYGPGATVLLDEQMPMPEKFEQSIIVPFRNGILLAIAAGYAATIGAEVIFYGAQEDDARFYPDCRQEFVSAIAQAISLGTESKLTVRNPLADKTKAEAIKLAVELGVPLELTWSCYLNRELHCGRCESCRNRKRAFERAGVKDPTIYAKPPEAKPSA
ncbi:MAG: 7-cyano-7-deazaguanine synthase QueC [Hadesarchaea archaeon]|nr:7-cyano-7-deazaguanine synthase QueC [Hadesarchaea archaeon]MDH5685176.1 7-cyano-7-deazaguanine synthase QueC [Hadesarchaea archaeon]